MKFYIATIQVDKSSFGHIFGPYLSRKERVKHAEKISESLEGDDIGPIWLDIDEKGIPKVGVFIDRHSVSDPNTSDPNTSWVQGNINSPL